MTGTSLQIREDQIEWDDRQRTALAAIGISESVPKAQTDLYLAYCQRTGLDPFTKQIYLIEREDRKNNSKKYTIQVSIDGFRLIAHRAADRTHDAIVYDDTQWCALDGVWRDIWSGAVPPAAAKVTIHRGTSTFRGIALFDEYATKWQGNPSGMWETRPAGQLAKCAEALALRRAFPHDLSGIYSDDEMAQSDNKGGTTVVVQQGKPQRLAQRAVAARAEPVDVDVEPEREPAAFDGNIDALLTRITTIEDRDELTRMWREYKDDATIADAIAVQGRLLAAANA